MGRILMPRNVKPELTQTGRPCRPNGLLHGRNDRFHDFSCAKRENKIDSGTKSCIMGLRDRWPSGNAVSDSIIPSGWVQSVATCPRQRGWSRVGRKSPSGGIKAYYIQVTEPRGQGGRIKAGCWGSLWRIGKQLGGWNERSNLVVTDRSFSTCQAHFQKEILRSCNTEPLSKSVAVYQE